MNTRQPSQTSSQDIVNAEFHCDPFSNGSTLSTFDVAYRSLNSSFPSAPGSSRGGRKRSVCVCVDELPRARDNLHPTWRAAYECGKSTCPGVDITYGEFAAHVGDLGRAEAPRQAADLYLAAACALCRRAALEMLDEYIKRSRPTVARVVRDIWVVDDVLQEVRYRLLVGTSPRIGSYRGTGPLGSWVRSIAANIAKDHVRTEGARRRREIGRPLGGLPADSTKSEDDAAVRCSVHRGCISICIEAIRLAFASLNADERRLLHEYFSSDVSIDTLSPRYLVNRATIARRIHRATNKVRRNLRNHLTSSYAREELNTLDSIALAVCRDFLDAFELLEPGPTPSPPPT